MVMMLHTNGSGCGTMQPQPCPRAGKRLRIFVGEAEEWQGRPLYRAILEAAQRHQMAGATVLRGIEGFGPDHHLVSVRLPDIADNLPLLIELVDSEEQIGRFLPVVQRMVSHGLITVTPVTMVSLSTWQEWPR
jgi:PII-like signaling protein